MDNERFTLDYLYHFAKAMQAIKDEENKKDDDNWEQLSFDFFQE